MESNQLSNVPNEEAVIEALTLTCEIDEYGTKTYLNKEGQYHRIHGPAIIWDDGEQHWCTNGSLHREDGPAVVRSDGSKKYYVYNASLSKQEFIQWQIKSGIKPIE